MRADAPEILHKDLVELLVERIGARGDGIAFYQGKPVFLPFTVPGDRVLARLGQSRGGGCEGRIVERLASGTGRAAPPCSHFGVCGGCTLQHLDEATYRAVKLGALSAALERVGIDPGVVRPVRVVPPGRRRVRLRLARPHDPSLPLRIGFRERYRHAVVDLSECLVMERPLFAVSQSLRELAARILPPGGNAEVTLTRTDSGIDLLIEAAERPELAALEALARFSEECDLARIVWLASGDEVPVVERRPVRVLLSGVVVPFPPGAFLQASQSAEAILIEEVLSGVGPRRPVVDLFAGLGTFSFALAQRGPVHAIEGEKRAVAALARAAADHANVTVEQRDLVRELPSAEELARYAAAVFNPPRMGASKVSEALAVSRLGTVVAISCNPATFARDAAKLIAGGYRLEQVTPVDQFVWTSHLEIAAVFRR
jgi:23S rRNA (uracil1939-C5)-methyltransferase